MPVPKPSKGESQDAFMGRCMRMMTDENKAKTDNQKRPRDQMIAICMTQFRRGNASVEESEASSITVNKSKEAMSDKAWGDVDKTALRNKILDASNKGSLVHSVYMLVEDGWESAPSEHLKYPVMELKGNTLVYNRAGLGAALQRAVAQNESGVVSKIHGIYKKLGIEESQK